MIVFIINKACDYYRQASRLGHINAQLNLTTLSNRIDINENEDEIVEETISHKENLSLHNDFLRFSLSNDINQDQLIDDNQFDFESQRVACLS